MTTSPYPAGSMPTNGRWGWYKDHLGDEQQRMSVLLKHIETERWALENWGKRQTAVGLARREDLLTGVKAIGPPGVEGFTKDQKSKLDKLVKTAEEAAKDVDGAVLGTAAHDATERIDRGEPIASVAGGMPYPWNQSLQAYAALRRLNGWVNVEIERTVEVDELGIRGTFDRVDLIPGLAALLGPGMCQYASTHHGHGGEAEGWELPVIVDVKTEPAPWLNGIHIAPQLAGYSRARRMWVPGIDQLHGPAYVDMPCVRQDVGIVVHVRDGDAVPYFFNLTEGWEAALAAAAQRDRLKRSKTNMGSPGAWMAPMPGVVRPKPAELLVEASAAKDEARRADPDWMTLPPVTDTNTLPVAMTLPAPLMSSALPEVAPAIEREPRAAEIMRESLIEAIWQAADVAELSRLYELAKAHDVPWEGPAAMAGAARQRQVQCVQRAMHDPATTAKCACGWMRGNRA